jgi:hypothetical protein
MHRFLFGTLLTCLFILVAPMAKAQIGDPKVPVCTAMDRPCLLRQIEALTPTIEQNEWKDQTYRELAKTYAYEGQPDKAIALIEKISKPDTKAMTIRGIGMAAAGLKWEAGRYGPLFAKLTEEAHKISEPAANGIALTYVAMAQAFAGDDAGARKTASTMQNAALRNKAYGETAEIQAERGDLKNVMVSLSAIDASSFRNKAYDTVSKIFLNKAMVEEAYACAMKIDNAYLKTKSIQRILNKGNAEEENMEPGDDLGKE